MAPAITAGNSNGTSKPSVHSKLIGEGEPGAATAALRARHGALFRFDRVGHIIPAERDSR